MAPLPETVDVLIVSLASTVGLRVADQELAQSLRRAGASVGVATARPTVEVPTLMLTDLLWARSAAQAAHLELKRTPARSIIYSSTTAAMFWPRPGAIRFDAPATGNRPGRHGLWQRPLEGRRLSGAPLLLPLSHGAMLELPEQSRDAKRAVVLPVPIEPSGTPRSERDIAAITYAANPHKKGLDRVLKAWEQARTGNEELVIAGIGESELHRAGFRLPEGARLTGMLDVDAYRSLLRRSRVFLCAPRREDYGQAQLEALADGCLLVSTEAPGPYAALPLARELDSRLVSEDLGQALRIALTDPKEDYATRAMVLLEPFRRETVDRTVADAVLPRLGL